MKDNKAYKPA